MSKQSLKLSQKKDIPEGWKEVQVGDHFDFKNGLNKAKIFFGQGTPIINYMDVYPHPAINKKNIHGKVTLTNDELTSFEIRKGDVLFTRTSETIEEIGLTSVVLDDVKKTVFSGFLLRARPKTKLFELEFKRYCFRSKNARSQIISTSSQTTRALTNGKLLSKVFVLIPINFQEQKNIAESISDIEKVIEKLEIVIKKKKHIQQGTIQELLTAKKRLRKFEKKQGTKQSEFGIIPKDWNVFSLKEKTKKIGSGITPRGGERVYKKEGRPFVRSQNVGWGNLILDDIVFIDEKTHSVFNSTEIKVDDVLLNITGASIGRSAVADSRVEKGNVNQHVCIIRTDSKQLISYYLNNFLLSNIGQRQIDMFQAGGNREGLNFGQIGSIQILCPIDVKEQLAIIQIISDMNSEIQELESKRDKYIMIKNGMMQKLLTGEIRLI
jgi:type I restriction enzyme, S subunit